MIARKFGPLMGGLFLAFPAIFPAGATLIKKHEKEKKDRAGDAAALDAEGAAMGSIGLLVFACILWKFLPEHATWLALTLGTIAWITVAMAIWRAFEYL
jgi:hypothetical protein